MKRMRGCLIAALLALTGCADSTLTAKDAGQRVPDAGPDGGQRVKLRTVVVNLPPIATRTISAGPDGAPVYGEIVPLDGAKACIVQRREAFAVFEPFEELDEPVCATSVAGQVVRIVGVPANSDLLISIEHEGKRPLALANRSGDGELISGWLPVFSLIMLEQGASDAWLEPATPAAEDHGTVAVGASSWWIEGSGQAEADVVAARDVFFGITKSFALIDQGVDLTVTPSGGGDPIALQSLDRFQFLSLPAGSARIEYSTDNRHLSCGGAAEKLGLTAGQGILELPVLPGHDSAGGPLCECRGDSNEDELLDLAACSFASDLGDDDAGAP
jgi:hypothetical protein